jgi:hypothetical protein
MKKIVLMVVAMLTMTVAFAENENTSAVKSVEAYDMTVNMRKLAVTLGLTFDQMDAVEEIHRQFCNEMMLVPYAKEDEKETLLDNAVKKDVRYMRYILNDKQYRTYLLLLNTTLHNRGLK